MSPDDLELIQDDWNNQRRLEFVQKASWYLFKKGVVMFAIAGAAVAGAFIFGALERPNELIKCENMSSIYQQAEDDQATHIQLLSLSYNQFPEEYDAESFRDLLQQQVRNFSLNVVVPLGFDGRNCSLMGQPGGEEYEWNFYSALLFSTTIMTTVGYGNIAPETSWGRIVCIAYAMCTIPLMLLCLSSIGDVMARTFRFVYFNFCCLNSCRRAMARRSDKGSQPKDGHPPQASPQGQSSSGSSIPLKPVNRGRTSGNSPVVEAEGDVTSDSSHANWMKGYRGHHSSVKPVDSSDVGTVTVDEDDDDDEYHDTPIPGILILSVVLAYAALGSVMFVIWEGWDFVESFYYVFITLATIGFGDIIPGTILATGIKPTSEVLKLVSVCIFMLFGMAFLSMALDLVQHELHRKLARAAGVKEENHEKEIEKDEMLKKE